MTPRYKLIALVLLLAGAFLSFPAVAFPTSLIPDASFTTLQGKTQTLGAYRNRKLMVWEVATWCRSCIAGLRAMQRHALELQMADITIILLRVYKNGGYPGLSIHDFVKRFAPGLLDAPNWVMGTANANFSKIYNSRHYPDIYYLINRQGKVIAVSSAPGATFATIRKFMGEN